MIKKHKFEMFRTIWNNFRFFLMRRLIIFHLGSKILKLDYIYKSRIIVSRGEKIPTIVTTMFRKGIV